MRSDTKITRVLVALASHGTSNDDYLHRVIEEYRSMPFDIDIVVLSNLPKQPAPGIEVLVSQRGPNPWLLPFLHKKLFAERLEYYDLFIYSEDDMLITENNLRAFLEVNRFLQGNEIAGFIRIEKGLNTSVNYPDVHGTHHWDPTSLTSRAQFVLAKFTNEHAACYVLTQEQLRDAIKSGGFLVEPHEWKYDLLCTAATDPYTQCGFTKLIPISHLDDFSVHHLSNKYFGKVGVDGPEMRAQANTMLQLVKNGCMPASLLATETKIWRGMYSKLYYEPPSEEVISMIPSGAGSVLSIGCGSGATECRLAEKGLRVVAVPLDPVICSSAAEKGVKIVLGSFRAAKEQLKDEQFDCVIYSNVLHLVRNPIEVLCLFRETLTDDSVVLIQTPNMMCVPAIWRRIRNPQHYCKLGNYDCAGVHISSSRKVREWCRKSGLKVERILGILHPRAAILRCFSGKLDVIPISSSLVCKGRRIEAFVK